jgi:hypothetical protein
MRERSCVRLKPSHFLNLHTYPGLHPPPHPGVFHRQDQQHGASNEAIQSETVNGKLAEPIFWLIIISGGATEVN